MTKVTEMPHAGGERIAESSCAGGVSFNLSGSLQPCCRLDLRNCSSCPTLLLPHTRAGGGRVTNPLCAGGVMFNLSGSL
eukprot:1177050-Prorocentrum_minimum.AAC.3